MPTDKLPVKGAQGHLLDPDCLRDEVDHLEEPSLGVLPVIPVTQPVNNHVRIRRRPVFHASVSICKQGMMLFLSSF